MIGQDNYYGSLDDEEAAKRGTRASMTSSKEEPLLPPREPSTAKSRGLRKRASVASSRKLANALRAASRRQIMQEEEVQPVMKSLFSGRKHHRQHTPHAQTKSSSFEVEALASSQLVSASTAPISATDNTSMKSRPPTTDTTSQSRQSAARHSSKKMHDDKKHHRHSWLYVLLHPHSSHPHAMWYKQFISIIILIDVAFFVASTEETWRSARPDLFYAEEGMVSSIFLLEYLCRLYVAPESHKYNHMTRLQARWHYMQTIPACIDLVSALPFFLELPTGFSLPNLTWLRFFRLVRILKTKSYVRSMDTVWRVIYYNREILYVALNMCILLVLVTAILMYYLRPQDPQDAEDFSSLLATMYLSAMMLTGQGQPEGDLPWYTKCVVLLTGIFSVAMFAIPASMLTWGFEAEAERCARKARQKYVSSLSTAKKDNEEFENEPTSNDQDDFSYANYISSSSSSEGDTTDEEYLDIIAGGGEEDEATDGNQEPQSSSSPHDEMVKQLIRTFQTSDVDASGSLSMDEFIELMTDPSAASQQLTMVGMATSVGLLVQRVQQLEHKLAENHRKLDQILEAVKRR